MKQRSRRTAVSLCLCLCLAPHHLCFRDPKPACGLVKKGWRRIRRPLLTSARRAPIDRSATSECRSLHCGYFKDIIQRTAKARSPPGTTTPEWPSPLRGCCIISGCSLPIAVGGAFEPRRVWVTLRLGSAPWEGFAASLCREGKG